MAEPIGDGDYVVRKGECIESIAFEHGLRWQSLWDDPQNAELKRVRQDPNVLLEGDRLRIPSIRPKSSDVPSDQRHQFRRKGVPSVLRLVLKDALGKAIANSPYVLDVDGTVHRGNTNASGEVQAPIAPDAKSGKLIVGEGIDALKYELQLGHVQPGIDTKGVQQRLNNLGYACGAVDGVLGPRTRGALRRFQTAHELPESGSVDSATADRLIEEHRS